MEIYSITLNNVTPVEFVTAKASYGLGLLTAFVGGFCCLFGIPNHMYTAKIEMAKTLAMQELEKKVISSGADGVMDVRCQIDGLTFMISGTTYKWSAEEKAKRETEKIAKRQAAEKAMREQLEQAKHEAEEKKKDQELKIQHQSGEQCQLCGEYFEHLTHCMIKDDMGTRYRNICDGCMQKYNATKQ